ncbi:MAG: nicotinate (nicotinamide) nucleotide adenylyltransferase [Fidelibacterota bacterium]|nr:MAG: nicotinate (nicotinamide) nucleotide adenylyltransferase [Candidatus Neomarinimicrobiota bacterium]
MMKVGLFGSSFDPPHNAHVDIATTATDTIPLDVLYLIPSYLAPLKTHPPEAAPEHRLAMAHLVAAMRPEWFVLTYEMDQARIVTSVETVEYMQRQQPDADFYLIIGGDQADQFHQWHDWKRLAGMVQIVCFDRSGSEGNIAISTGMKLIPFDAPLSSSLVRQTIRTGGCLNTVLPQAIESYIQEHHLYQ